MFTRFGGVIRSVIPACSCFFRELHVIKFADTFIQFVISDAAGNGGGVLDRSTVVGSNYVDQGFRVISYSSWCANQLRETKECNIDLDSQLSDLFKKLTLESPRKIHSLRDN